MNNINISERFCTDVCFSLLNLSKPVCVCVCVESVQEAVGQQVKLCLVQKVNLEVKGDKLDSRILVSEVCSTERDINDPINRFHKAMNQTSQLQRES